MIRYAAVIFGKPKAKTDRYASALSHEGLHYVNYIFKQNTIYEMRIIIIMRYVYGIEK